MHRRLMYRTEAVQMLESMEDETQARVDQADEKSNKLMRDLEDERFKASMNEQML